VANVEVPTFSKQPLSYITHIGTDSGHCARNLAVLMLIGYQSGEHLFDLMQQLEPFAATHPSLSLAPGGGVAESGESDDDSESHGTRLAVCIAALLLAACAALTLRVCVRPLDFAWARINAVSRGTMSLYVQRILEIPVLTNQGSLQLAADIRTSLAHSIALSLPRRLM
jgi:hypothetical protein